MRDYPRDQYSVTKNAVVFYTNIHMDTIHMIMKVLLKESCIFNSLGKAIIKLVLITTHDNLFSIKDIMFY